MADLLHDSSSSHSRNGVVAGYIDDLYWAAPFEKMIEVIKFVMERGPAYGYNLNMKKCVYLMAPVQSQMSQSEMNVRIHALVNLGIPIGNVKIHPECQPCVSPSVFIKRNIEWGFKILGAFVGTDEYVLCNLESKMSKIDRVTDLLIQYPKAQFRYCLHRFCYDAKVNYWLRAQLPLHGRRFVDDFRKQQMRLVASYHGVYEATEIEDKWSDVVEWCERATLPVELGGMAIRNMAMVALTAFACSLASSLKHMAVIFPERITLGSRGAPLHISQSSSSEISAQVLSSVGEYRRLVPQGRFKENDDFSAILKIIVELEEHDHVASSEPQLQSSSHVLSEEAGVNQRSKRGRSPQGVLYSDFVKEEFKRLLSTCKVRAEAAPGGDRVLDRIRYRNWLSVINPDSGVWLTAGASPKIFEMSTDEFASAVCRRNTVEDPIVPKYNSWMQREDPSLFRCACDGGARPKVIDPCGYHFVGCKTAANAIRLHDEVVAVVAWLFRSLRLDVIVEPTSLFSDNLGDVSNQRPDIHIRNPRKSRQVIIDVALTGVDGQSRTSDEAVERPLQVRFDQKMAKYGQVATQKELRLIPAVFSHTGQIHEEFKTFAKEQIRAKFEHFESQVKSSKVKSQLNWWVKCISAVIAKTASRNVAFKARKLRESIMEGQDSFIMRQPEDVEAEFGEDDEDVVADAGNNADLYAANQASTELINEAPTEEAPLRFMDQDVFHHQLRYASRVKMLCTSNRLVLTKGRWLFLPDYFYY